MCSVSMVMDHHQAIWTQRLDQTRLTQLDQQQMPNITRQEIAEFKKLLERAREYDKRNNQPDCELEEKKNKVRELAEQLGVKIDFL